MAETTSPTTVLVIDVQRAVVEGSVDVPGVIERINHLIGRARERGTPLVFVQHEEDEDPSLRHGSEGWQFVPGLAYSPGDVVVAKRFRDSFADTTLEEHLRATSTGHLVITGSQSDYCVQTTALSALQHGYDVTLVSDAHTTCSTGPADGAIDGASVIAFINGHFATLSYPGRRIVVAPADEVAW